MTAGHARLAREIARSNPGALAAALTGGLLAGAATSALLSQVASAADEGGVGLHYLALCGLVLAARLGAELSLLRGLLGWTQARRVRLAARIVAAEPRDVERVGSARLMSVLTDDVTALAAGLPVACLAGVELGVAAVCIGGVALASPAAAAAAVAFGALGLWLLEGPRAVAEGTAAHARAAHDALARTLELVVDGARELKQDPQVRRALFDGWLRPQAALHRDLSARARLGFAAREAAAAGLAMMAMAAVAAAGHTPSLVVLVYLLLPARRIVGFGAPIARASVALRRLDDVERALPPASQPLQEAGPSSFREIELREVALTLPGGFRLGPLTLAVRPGEIVLVTGGNGSGKSTLLRLLTGLEPPESGEVLIDGAPVPPARLRGLCSAVFWDHHLFGDVHDRAAPLGELAQRALERLELAERVSLVAGRWSTTALSQGQRKRLALAAALLEGRPLLVLDEWAAEQDPSFKRVFYTELLPELRRRGAGVVVVSHDDAWFDLADRRIDLRDGQMLAIQPAASSSPR